MGDKTVEIGDFLFEEKKYDFEKLWNDIYYKNSYKKYEDRALELMRLHYEFFRIINDLKECEAVLRGAKIVCTHGNHPIYLDIYEDHGVYDKNTPVMSCADCKTGQNIYSFGACGNDKFEPVYSDMIPPPKELMKDNRGNEHYKCLPIILDGVWGLGDENSRSIFFYALARQYNLVFGQEWEYDEKDLKKALKKRKNMKNKEEYVKIWMSNANVLCLYGGIITVVENAEPELEVESDPEPKIEFTDSTKRIVRFPDIIKGRITFKNENTGEFVVDTLNLAPNLTWFSFTQKGRTKDSDGYYRISVGPKVLIPDYSDEGKLWAEEFSDTNEINIKVTAKLKLKEQIIDKEGKENDLELKCVVIGIKAHTYNIHPDTNDGHKHKIFDYNKNIMATYDIENGLVQTGIAYPNCYNAQNNNVNDGPIVLNCNDGSVIEFYGYKKDLDFNPNDYRLVEIVVPKDIKEDQDF